MRNNDLCGNCAAWFPPPAGTGSTMGECRKHAPVVFMILVGLPPVSEAEKKIIALAGARAAPPAGPQPRFLSAWPAAPAEEWCFEHEKIATGVGL
jgi:hypothetical protein